MKAVKRVTNALIPHIASDSFPKKSSASQHWQHHAGRYVPPEGHIWYKLVGALLSLAILKAIVEAIIGHALF